AVEKDASDIFITVGVPPTLRIQGSLVPVNNDILLPKDTEGFVKELFGKDSHFDAFMEDGEKDFSFSLSGIGRFRVDAYIQRGSMAAAIRVLHYELPNPHDLGIPDTILDFYKRTKGLILVTGPTGSGKSTTLASIINLINKERGCHIITLEDPIEYLHRHQKSIVDQREIGVDTKSYAKALRAALRQSPDVILIGEMRDYETISIALTAAETGHLVFSTLHTLGAAKTMDRIIDVFPPNQQQQIRIQLSTVLQAVVTQQLIPSPEKGRVAAFEIMMINNAIRNMIRESKTPQIDGAIQTGRSAGMISMDMSLAELCRKGLITKEEAIIYSINPEMFLKYIE
ncbi:MAG: pilT, partial [Clostridia bacterium]|nr:pilT [Clostridia bacterium]